VIRGTSAATRSKAMSNRTVSSRAGVAILFRQKLLAAAGGLHKLLP